MHIAPELLFKTMTTIVSLFDGISCCYMALQKAGIKFDKYIASEVDKFAQKASLYNFPDIMRVGDVRNVKINEPVWLLAGGSPCQSFSFAGKMNGMSTKDNIDVLTLEQYLELKEKGFEFEGQSYLFWEYIRIMKETKPKYFFLENVEMPEKWEKLISKTLGVNPIKINSSLVSAQNRVRLYWTNIGLSPNGLFGDLQSIIPQPKDKGVFIKDILQNQVDGKYFVNTAKLQFQPGNEIVKIDKKGNIKSNQEKASCFTAGANSGGNHSDMDLLVLPKVVAMRGRNPKNPKSRVAGLKTEQMIEPRSDGKSNCLTTVQKDNMVAIGCDYRTDEGLRFRDNGKTGTLTARARNDGSCGQLVFINKPVQINPSTESGGKQPYQQNRIYDSNAKAPCLMHNLTSGSNMIYFDYSIRRFTPVEVCRLQTIPDNFFFDENGNNIISDSQIYKAVGNGWTVDVIAHIFSYLK